MAVVPELQLKYANNLKAGTSSIKKFFAENRYFLKGIPVLDITPEDIIKEQTVTFGVVRNPYTRCISSWKYCDSTKHLPLLQCLKYPPTPNTSRIFVDYTDPTNIQTRIEVSHDYRHFVLPQSFWLHPQGLLNKRVHHLLKFENIEEEIYNLCDQYGIEIYKKFPKLNVGKYDHNIQLTSEEKEAIYNFYKVDFDMFGFKKE